MPYAVTLALDPAAAARVEATWRLLDVRGVSDGALKLGYKPHVTLGIFPDDVPSSRLLTAARQAAESGAPCMRIIQGCRASMDSVHVSVQLARDPICPT